MHICCRNFFTQDDFYQSMWFKHARLSLHVCYMSAVSSLLVSVPSIGLVCSVVLVLSADLGVIEPGTWLCKYFVFA